MLHKISELCKKIDFIKSLSLTLYKMKYEDKNASREQIDDLIEQIQYECLLISNDKWEYRK